jgi:hypothetical protein
MAVRATAPVERLYVRPEPEADTNIRLALLPAWSWSGRMGRS